MVTVEGSIHEIVVFYINFFQIIAFLFRVTFNKFQVVLLDGFPKRENRVVTFRFFIVLPHEAKMLGKKLEKPLLSTKIITGKKT